MQFACNRDNSLVEESYKAWISLIKPSRMRGPVGEMSLAICATNTHMALSMLAESSGKEKKTGTAKVESLLREALLVSLPDWLPLLLRSVISLIQ